MPPIFFVMKLMMTGLSNVAANRSAPIARPAPRIPSRSFTRPFPFEFTRITFVLAGMTEKATPITSAAATQTSSLTLERAAELERKIELVTQPAQIARQPVARMRDLLS